MKKKPNDDEFLKLLEEYRDRPAELREKLFPMVYEEMHRIAQRQMSLERSSVTLQPTVLVNEAYLRLANSDPRWKNRGHFMAIAAHIIRHVAVEYARRRKAEKRGGGIVPEIADELIADKTRALPLEDILTIHIALEKLEKEYPEPAELLNLIIFAGMTIDEAADTLGMHRTKTKEQVTFAKAWLKRELRPPKKRIENA